MKSLLVSIGDSWAAGEGAWTESLIDKCNGRVQYIKHRQFPPNNELIEEIISVEQRNCWLKKLRDKYFPEWETLNLGVPGCDNSLAVQQLYLTENNLSLYDNLIVIFMLSVPSRLSFLTYNGSRDNMTTIYPVFETQTKYSDPVEALSVSYGQALYSEKNATVKFWLSVLQAQDFVKARNGRFVFCNGWNSEYPYEELPKHFSDLIDQNSNLHNFKPYESFHTILLEKEELDEDIDPYQFLQQLDRPSKYLTNCNGFHPSMGGQEFIADELGEFLNVSG